MVSAFFGEPMSEKEKWAVRPAMLRGARRCLMSRSWRVCVSVGAVNDVPGQSGMLGGCSAGTIFSLGWAMCSAP